MGEGSQDLRGSGPGRTDVLSSDPDDLARRDPETLRQGINLTRQDMGHTLDEIEDRIRPRRIIERRTAGVRSALVRAKDTVMGSGQEAGSGLRGSAEKAGGAMRQARHDVGERAGEAVEAMEHAPDAALERTRGNPLGAGLIAFGAGVVAAGLLPDSRSERRLAVAVTEQLEPVKEELGSAAGELGQEMAESARESARRTADHAKDQARETVDDVRQEGSGDEPRPREEAARGERPPDRYSGGGAA